MEFHGISDDFKGCYPMDTENMIVGIIDETCVFFCGKVWRDITGDQWDPQKLWDAGDEFRFLETYNDGCRGDIGILEQDRID